MRVSDIRAIFKEAYQYKEFNEAGLLEIVGASFEADEDYIFGQPDLEYIAREIAWYHSKSRNVYDMDKPPKIWRDVATEDGRINSNYGWCIFSSDNHNQYYKALECLRKNPNSRQATMIYTRPTMHEDSSVDGMYDFMCTNAVTYHIRGNRLHCTVQMRSNDAIYGYKNDYAWQKYVLDKMARDLNILSGTIYWQVASLHIYPRHFKFFDTGA